MCPIAWHKFPHQRPCWLSQPYQHHIDKTAGTVPAPAFHCAKLGPWQSGDRDWVDRCGAAHRPEPKGRSDHTAVPTNLRPLATQTPLHSGDPHRARICQVLRPFPQHYFRAAQSRIDDIHQKFDAAFLCARTHLLQNNRETLLAVAP